MSAYKKDEKPDFQMQKSPILVFRCNSYSKNNSSNMYCAKTILKQQQKNASFRLYISLEKMQSTCVQCFYCWPALGSSPRRSFTLWGNLLRRTAGWSGPSANIYCRPALGSSTSRSFTLWGMLSRRTAGWLL